jgi:hypothetical protein
MARRLPVRYLGQPSYQWKVACFARAVDNANLMRMFDTAAKAPSPSTEQEW